MESQINYISTQQETSIDRKNWISITSFSADLHPRQKSLNGSYVLSTSLSTTQWPVSVATLVELMSRPSQSNWLVRLLSIKDQTSLAVKQNSSLTQNRLASRKNFRTMPNLTDASGIPNSVDKDSGSSVRYTHPWPWYEHPHRNSWTYTHRWL